MEEQEDKELEELLAYKPFACGSPSGRSVYKAPEFVKRLNAFEEARAGSTVVFGCTWKGFPKPTIKWFHDDEEVTEDPRYALQDDGNVGELALTIADVRKKDEGAYKCKAENQEGVTSTTGYLSVTGDYSDKPLSHQPRKNEEHAVSNPPPLRTIIEQRSLEEREADKYHNSSSAMHNEDTPTTIYGADPASSSHQLKEDTPMQDIIHDAQHGLAAWPFMPHMMPSCPNEFPPFDNPGGGDVDVDDSGSDTSLESQEADALCFSITAADENYAVPVTSPPLNIAEEDENDMEPPVFAGNTVMTNGVVLEHHGEETPNGHGITLHEGLQQSDVTEDIMQYASEMSARLVPQPAHTQVTLPQSCSSHPDSLPVTHTDGFDVTESTEFTDDAVLLQHFNDVMMDNDTHAEPLSPTHIEFDRMMFEVRQRIEKQKSPTPLFERLPPLPTEDMEAEPSEDVIMENNTTSPTNSDVLTSTANSNILRIATNSTAVTSTPNSNDAVTSSNHSVRATESEHDKESRVRSGRAELHFPWLFFVGVSASATLLGSTLQLSALSYVAVLAALSFIIFVLIFDDNMLAFKS